MAVEASSPRIHACMQACLSAQSEEPGYPTPPGHHGCRRYVGDPYAAMHAAVPASLRYAVCLAVMMSRARGESSHVGPPERVRTMVERDEFNSGQSGLGGPGASRGDRLACSGGGGVSGGPRREHHFRGVIETSL